MNIINCPIAHGQMKRGVIQGANILSNELSAYFNIPVIDVDHKALTYSSIPKEKITLYKYDITVEYNKKLYQVLMNTNDDFNIIVGGDHSISAATTLAYMNRIKGSKAILWIDAHPDLNTMESTSSFNTHGMSLAFSTGLMNPQINGIANVGFDNIIYFGLRSIDPFEKDIIEKKNIIRFDKQQVNETIDTLQSFDSIHVSFDVDSLDPSIIPCTGTPVPDGISVETVEILLSSIRDKVKSIDIVEFNPEISKNNSNESLRILVQIIVNTFDKDFKNMK